MEEKKLKEVEKVNKPQIKEEEGEQQQQQQQQQILDSNNNNNIDICNLCDLESSCSHNKKRILINDDNRIRKIDIHCHILPDKIPDFQKEFGYGGFINIVKIPDVPNKLQMWKDNKLFREIDDKCYSPEARLQHMNEEGVDVQVLSTVPVMFSYFAQPQDGLKVSQFLNNHISSICKKYKNRFIGLGTLPLQNIKMSVQELIRCIKELGLIGIEIGSHVEKWNLDDERFYPLWDAAEKLGACIFVHPWEMMGEKDMSKYWLPWLVGMPAETCRAICCIMFGGVLKKYPKLKFCFAHGGGSFAHTIGRIQHGYDCRPDLVQINLKGKEDEPMSWKGKFWVDSLVHNEKAFDYLLSVIGQDKICLGTDYPFPLGECYPLKKCGELIEHHSTLTYKQKMQLLWNNGLDFISKCDKDFELSSDIQHNKKNKEQKQEEKEEEKEEEVEEEE